MRGYVTAQRKFAPEREYTPEQSGKSAKQENEDAELADKE